MTALALFGLVNIDAASFASMAPHVRSEAALLLRERLSDPSTPLRRAAATAVREIDAAQQGQFHDALLTRHAYRLPGEAASAGQLNRGQACSAASEKAALTHGAGRVLVWLCAQPERQAQALLSEIAEAIGMPDGTVKGGLQRLHAIGYIEMRARGRGYPRASYRVTPLGLDAAMEQGLLVDEVSP